MFFVNGYNNNKIEYRRAHLQTGWLPSHHPGTTGLPGQHGAPAREPTVLIPTSARTPVHVHAWQTPRPRRTSIVARTIDKMPTALQLVQVSLWLCVSFVAFDLLKTSAHKIYIDKQYLKYRAILIRFFQIKDSCRWYSNYNTSTYFRSLHVVGMVAIFRM